MARISERDLILPTLHLLGAEGIDELSTTQLIAQLRGILRPEGQDAEILANRNDDHFSQKVRNLRSHKSLQNTGFITYQRRGNNGYWRLTDMGRAYLEKHDEIVPLLTRKRLGYARRIAGLNSVRTPTTQRQWKPRALAFDEDLEIEEGEASTTVVERRKRSRALRRAAVAHFARDGSIACAACGFDFATAYGSHGAGYIEIHHQKPLFMYEDSDLRQAIRDALRKVVPLCANCHRMVHRAPTDSGPLSVDQLVALMKPADDPSS